MDPVDPAPDPEHCQKLTDPEYWLVDILITNSTSESALDFVRYCDAKLKIIMSGCSFFVPLNSEENGYYGVRSTLPTVLLITVDRFLFLMFVLFFCVCSRHFVISDPESLILPPRLKNIYVSAQVPAIPIPNNVNIVFSHNYRKTG